MLYLNLDVDIHFPLIASCQIRDHENYQIKELKLKTKKNNKDDF